MATSLTVVRNKHRFGWIWSIDLYGQGKRCDLCLANDVCNARNEKLIESSKFHQLEDKEDIEKVYSHWLDTVTNGITTERHKKNRTTIHCGKDQKPLCMSLK